MLQNEWQWSKANEKLLAQFVNEKAFELLPKLSVNRGDLIKNKKGRRELVRTIYDSLMSLKIYYTNEQYHPEKEIQIIRTPLQILSKPGEGTCLDLAILFCSMCFGCDLLPLLIVIDGHALAAVSLTKTRDTWEDGYDKERNLFNNLELFSGEENLAQLKDLINNEIYIAIECTGFAHAQSLSDLEQLEAQSRQSDGTLAFDKAIDVGFQQLSNYNRPFKFAIDIAAAQYLWKIKPLEIPQFTEEKRRIYEFNQKVAKAEGGELNNLIVDEVVTAQEIHSIQELGYLNNVKVTNTRANKL